MQKEILRAPKTNPYIKIKKQFLLQEVLPALQSDPSCLEKSSAMEKRKKCVPSPDAKKKKADLQTMRHKKQTSSISASH